METKSRYEVIAGLEEKKRKYILQRDSMDETLEEHMKELKYLKRQLEDKEEEIENFKKNQAKNVETFNALIASVDESLAKLSEINTNKS